MYDVWRVRRLCEEIAIEQDPEKAHDLIKLLSAVIREKNEEIVFNLAVLRHKFYDGGSVSRRRAHAQKTHASTLDNHQGRKLVEKTDSMPHKQAV